MKTLLLNPPPEEIIEPGDAPPYPHIGLGYIAGYLRSKKCQVDVLDAKLDRLNSLDVIGAIDDIKPDIIGLTAFTQEIVHVANIAQELKNRHPHCHIVIGGIHATVLPSETLKDFPVFDYAIFGEGEITLYELVKSLENNSPLNEVRGLGFRNKRDICINESRPWNSELDKLPFPAWDLFTEAKVYPVITTRGCPFRCIFCTRPYGSRIRERSPENVASEVEELVTIYKTKEVVFWDETFGVNKKRAMKIADLFIQENMRDRIRWDLHSRVDTVDYELLEKLKKAGCFHVGFGVESGNAKILEISMKGITLEKAQEAVKIAKTVGLSTSSYFILGLPYETKKTAWDTINFARKLNTNTVSIAIMIPFPKTEIANMVKNGEGGYKQISYDWNDFNKQTGAVIELDCMSRKMLVFFQILGYLMCYICNFRFRILYRLVKSRFKQVMVLVRNLFQ